MTKIPWSTIESVGDQSEYITAIAQYLEKVVGVIKGMVAGKYFRSFCDKFVEYVKKEILNF